MQTTAKRPRVKGEARISRQVILLRLITANIPGLIEVTASGQTSRYLVRRIPSSIGGRAFELAKVDANLKRDLAQAKLSGEEIERVIKVTGPGLARAGAKATPQAVDQARREAERRFGSVSTTRRRLAAIGRQRDRAQLRDELWQDLRYAVRGARMNPGFAIVVTIYVAPPMVTSSPRIGARRSTLSTPFCSVITRVLEPTSGRVCSPAVALEAEL